MSLYKHDNGEITEYAKLDMPEEKDIESFIHRHPDVVERDIMIVGRQVRTSDSKWIDLLGIDKHGNVVVIEVKKGDAPRSVVSQILDYAVWASDIEYNELNEAYSKLVNNYRDFCKTEEISDGRPDLHAAMERRFGAVPRSFNPGQRLYVVGEGIEKKTDDMCAYLRQNGLEIRCVSLGFFGDGDGRDGNIQERIRAVHTDAAAERQDNDGSFDKWEYNLGQCSADVSGAIRKVKSYVEDELKCLGEISERGATCTFYAGGDCEHGTRFAIIYAYRTKDYGNFEFISDPQHDFNDDRVARSTYAFGNAGRDVRIVKDNLDIITECAKHAHDAAMKVGASGSG